MRNAVAPAALVEHPVSLHAQSRLPGALRVVDPGVDDLAVAARRPRARPLVALQDQEGRKAGGQARRHREPDHPGADDGERDVGHGGPILARPPARGVVCKRMRALLVLFVVLRLAQQLAEHVLVAMNRHYAQDRARLAEAGRALQIGEGDMEKATVYASDRYRFGVVAGWAEVFAQVAFIAFGGVGFAEEGGRGGAGGPRGGAI